LLKELEKGGEIKPEGKRIALSMSPHHDGAKGRRGKEEIEPKLILERKRQDGRKEGGRSSFSFKETFV